MDEKKDRNWEDISVGEELPPVQKKITQEIINRYAVASEDPNPLHTDPEFASKTPFKGTIAHGTMCLAYVSQMMMQWFPHRWLTGGKMDVSFIGPARPGDVLWVKGKVKEKLEENKKKEVVFDISCENQDLKKIISGKASIIWE
jgi:3-hydroxybutyryl-CoA dehydratase